MNQPDPLDALQGLPLQEATCRLLRALGSAVETAEFARLWPLDGRVDRALKALDHLGHPARAVTLGLEDLRVVPLPTLVRANDGSWLVLRKRNRRSFVLEGAKGLETRTITQVQAGLSGLAFERVLGAREGGGARLRLFALLGAQRRLVIRLLVLSVLLQAAAIAAPQLSGHLLGRALPDGDTPLVYLLAGGILGAAALAAAFAWTRDRLLLFIATHADLALKRGFMDHVLRLPLVTAQRHSTGELLQAFSGITTARALLGERGAAALLDIAVMAACLAVMAVRMPGGAWVATAAGALIAATTIMAGTRQAREQAREVEAQARQRGYLTELVTGIGTVRALGVESICSERWARRLGTELRVRLRKQRAGLWSEVGADGIRQAATLAMLVWGGYGALQGTLSLVDLFAYLFLGEVFLQATAGVAQAGLALTLVRVQLSATDAVFMTPALPRLAPDPSPVVGRIEMRDVWYRYTPDGPWVLKDHSFTVEPGEVVVLDSASGTGKTTMLRLLAGLCSPERGTVRLDRREPRTRSASVFYLPQFPQLHAGSMMDNLQTLSRAACQARILEAARLTGLERLASTMPMGFATPLPHGGGTLSGGQRQLLALTAALASDCPVLLLDEPLASLDSIQRERLMGVLRAQGRTLVIAEHGQGHDHPHRPTQTAPAGGSCLDAHTAASSGKLFRKPFQP